MIYKDDFIKELVTFYKNNLNLLRNFSLSKINDSITHKHIIPYGSYSPWYDDLIFLKLYEQINAHTLVDIYRCFELYQYVIKNKHIEGDILEIGVWKGGTGCVLAKALNEVSPDSKTILIDTFEGVVKAGVNDTTYKGGEHSDTSKEIVEQLIIECQVKNVFVKRGIFPDTVMIDDTTKLRLCHIDVDTYDSAKDIFNAVWPHIVVGGAVIFDDYGFWGVRE